MSRVFASGPRDWSSIPGQVIPKTKQTNKKKKKEKKKKGTLLNTQHYKLEIKDKVEQSKEWSSTLPYTFM